MQNSQPSFAHMPALPIDDGPARRIGYLLLLVTFGLFGGWASLAPLDSAALAPGVVTVKTYRKTVQHLEGGIVRELRVHDGDRVSAGDLLLVLDNTQARSEMEAMRSQLIAALELQARLEAERDALPAPAAVPTLDPADPRVREARDSEARIFQARRNSLQGEVGLQEKTIGQIEEQIRGFKTIVASKQMLAASYEAEIVDLRALLAEGYVDKQRLREQERSLSRLQTEIAETRSQIAQARINADEATLKILQLKKTFASEVAGLLGDARTKVYELRERLATLQDRDQRTDILAPESGMIMGMTVHTLGAVVSPGTALLDIVPANEELIVEAQVSPMDIDRIAVGKLANIRFSAFKNSTTPVVEGQLVQVSADRLINKDTGAPYYLARLALTDKGRQALGGLVLVPGMPVEVLINTGERTLLQYLIQPASNAFARSLIED
ncbi:MULTISPECIES: HlyD family type I secretion periplasmic adaptor subunit [unclassified Pseudomonas]|uniref:HlyD family type I secretion periplasmic adaptor subunit n=1 Tax=unclassified Pseudomonas TaxID=196821 RepID=UPI0011A9AD78|nr:MULTISPECIES: HlyD family type I secretion periplasmic adaptor subunit [unclassified Pseudomonas]TWC22992.1 epimerase transport system membrane fusion protein [Pseudomonas sp. SJZ075]TWC38128.1 epimerase transport system membrane fusion protein [Pseudomonas sp. SJZ078]TWC58718.1 epimerase transport system membrane fusion protein [Pseudomonas sp. SJZ124]TWC94417.1 epimerase transport system membrane fusion protein [Pseudomonas sp. SJZ101]